VRKTRYRLVVSETALPAVRLTVVGRIFYPDICSNAAEGADSSHHRLSDKVNCDLTLGLISGLFPAVKGHYPGSRQQFARPDSVFNGPIAINLSPSPDSQYASAAAESKMQ